MDKFKKLKMVTALTLLGVVTACGGGGASSGSSTNSQSTNSTKDLSSIQRITVASVNLNSETGYSGSDTVWYNVLGKGDIDGDGYDDLVVGLFRVTGASYDPSGEIKPIVLFYDASSDTYKTNSQVQSVIAKNQHPRQVAIADFDGDGRNDVFIADHGYDDAPYGNQNTLLLNKLSGFVDGTSTLPQLTDFSHGLIMSDFNKDGKIDLLVLNNKVNSQSKCEAVSGFSECTYTGPKYSESYTLIRTDVGLSKSVLNIPDSTINFLTSTSVRADRLYVGYSKDFGNDGYDDLVVSDHVSLKVIERNRDGSYATAQVFNPPSSARASCSSADMPYSAITSYDMDGDGVDEIIASFACNLKGVQFQVFKRDTSGSWSDKTSTFIDDQTANTALGEDGWCYKFDLKDLNGDGLNDLICQSTRGMNSDRKNNIIWYGGSKLTYSDVYLTNGSGTNFHMTVRNKEGSAILGFKSYNGILSVYKWQL